MAGSLRRWFSGGMEEPLRNFWPAFRTWRKWALSEKSAHRGIVTAHSHSLYARSQAVQLTAREYCDSGGASHWTCWREKLKFRYRFLALLS